MITNQQLDDAVIKFLIQNPDYVEERYNAGILDLQKELKKVSN